MKKLKTCTFFLYFLLIIGSCTGNTSPEPLVENFPTPPAPHIKEQFFKAAEEGDIEKFKELLAQGMDINAVSEGYMNMTALHYAVDGEHVDMVEFILQDPNSNKHPLARLDATEFLAEPIVSAVVTGNLAIVNLILSESPAIPKDQLMRGLELLIRRYDSNVDRGDDNDCRESFLSNDSLVMDRVIEYGKIDINKDCIVGSKEMSLLHLAALTGDMRTVQLLVEKGADANILDSDGDTPLHKALDKVEQRLRDSHLQAPDIAQDSLRWFYAADHVPIEQSYLEIMRLLVESGANLSLKNKRDSKPLDNVKTRSIMRALLPKLSEAIEGYADNLYRDESMPKAIEKSVADCQQRSIDRVKIYLSKPGELDERQKEVRNGIEEEARSFFDTVRDRLDEEDRGTIQFSRIIANRQKAKLDEWKNFVQTFQKESCPIFFPVDSPYSLKDRKDVMKLFIKTTDRINKISREKFLIPKNSPPMLKIEFSSNQ